MNTYILRRQGSGVSTVAGIADQLPDLSVRVVRDTRFARVVRRRGLPTVLIRWGCTAECPAPIEVMTPDMIDRVNDKPFCRRMMIDAGIPSPKTFFSKAEVRPDATFPLIGRKTYHSQGKGMRVIPDARALTLDMQSTYWSEYIRKDKEYRVYTFFGRVLGVCEKRPDDPNAVSWNNSLGNGTFQTVEWRDWPLDVCLLALKATKVAAVDFSAVDIIKKGADAYVLELNNAPTCSEYRQTLFARAFRWLIAEVETTGAKPPIRDLPEVIRTYKSMIHVCVKRYASGPETSEESGGESAESS